ncbi:potassium voltage-gated channel subfamily E member 2-like [Colossoma macropomum]|uniref:potassium voltage-gated channel subfamily E member 2-like n=1 Tax=Colossoma macropomum TaxID=42526 RepID=UPI001863EAE8|nr:potassium voltage-gated channel subfamily E member 2-like [Colossoma macropomum]XP_036429277.1 potassium voltage-gated channel subfamily E member 2-like [Colossoma macropomum]
MIVSSDWSNLTLHLQDSLTSAVGHFLEQWQWNVTQAERTLDARLAEENFRDVIWYLVVMIGMFAFIVVAILVSTVKSKRREHSNDPYHKYIEGEWSTQPQIQAYNQSYVISNPSTRTFDGPGSP